ncbi:ATP-binding protein [Dactylosporangium sp. AC04546]|uniref:ATP-binding protein n=1 Tax=Dactylosporangium sp. AC04546 TaxID=2862460 RepID=UPI001EDDEF2D|nr:ATP-binding protein [Dactylosporangium sp. AC04546]WVK87892.1 ATP-binding protein [Dactylosporangium sp. AC04546]
MTLRRWLFARRRQRDGTAEILLHLHRRNQALLHRQLAVLDGLERRVDDAGHLGDLFRADHLGAQIRRNAERAILLAGERPGRQWTRPVPLVDVARSAAASVERQAAVLVTVPGAPRLAGPAVTDVLHLLTELIENATRACAGDGTVRVSGEQDSQWYRLIVRDQGSGMAPADLAAARDALARPFRPLDPQRAGLRLAGRLARAQGAQIDLEESSRGGTVAQVRIPLTLILTTDDASPPSTDALRGPGVPAEADPVTGPGTGSPAGRGAAEEPDAAEPPASPEDPRAPQPPGPPRLLGVLEGPGSYYGPDLPEAAGATDGPGRAAAADGPVLPVRTPRAVPSGSAGLARRRQDGEQDGAGRRPADRTARFRERVASRGAASSAGSLGLPSTVDSTVDGVVEPAGIGTADSGGDDSAQA